MREAIVYHSVDPMRLTEDYFKIHHKQQGRSRMLMNDKGIGRIFFDLGRATAQFAFYSLGQNERDQIPKQRPHLSLSRNASKPSSRIATRRKPTNRICPRRSHLSVLFCAPNPSKLKSKPKLVFAGLMSCLTPKVIVQQSHDESNLTPARTPIKRLLITS
jgi:hypothetical protein